MELTDHPGQKIFEKIDTKVFSDPGEASKIVAGKIADLI